MSKPKKQKFSPEQLAIVEQYRAKNIDSKIVIRILGRDIFDAILRETVKPIEVKEKVRPHDVFYFTVVKIPNNSIVVPNRWSVFGCVEDPQGKIIHTFSTHPSSKMIAIGKLKNAIEGIFGEFDLKRGGDLRQLYVLDNHPLINQNVVIHKQIFIAPWIRIQRRPNYAISIGSIADIQVLDGVVAIVGFKNNESSLIEDRTRTNCIEAYAKLMGHTQSIDTSPLFSSLAEEWKVRRQKRDAQKALGEPVKLIYPPKKDRRRKKNVTPLGAPETVGVKV